MEAKNMMALRSGQQRHDAAEERYVGPRNLTYAELYELVLKQGDNLTLLLAEARDAGQSLNRWAPCAGARILRICNEIEGVEDDE